MKNKHIWINGAEQAIEESCKNLGSLLESLDVNPKTVVVEHNKKVVPAPSLQTTEVKAGDVVEIVHFVGGGAPEESENAEPVAKKPVKKKAAKASGASKPSTRKGGPANLVIVESPSKAKTINKFLGNDYQVEASMGHVRDLPKSKMGIDLEHDFKPAYVISQKAKKTVTHLKKQARGKSGIFLAPDPDREGEAISWHLEYIMKETGEDFKIQRVVFNEITKDAVREAFKHPREVKMNLVNAQQARRVLDRIVGYEISPLLWKKVGKGLSAGRVQSVALRLIVDREREIRKFVPVEYWSVEANLSSKRPETAAKAFKAKLERIGTEKADLKTKEQTDAVREDLSKLPFIISKIEKSERRRRPQAPYTTSKLQQEAFTRLGFPAAKTMMVAQKLYEGIDLGEEGTVGLITYMRTDSVNISKGAAEEAADYLKGRFGKEFIPDTPPVYKAKKGAQEAHEAIRPSSARRDPASIRAYLEDDQFKLYELIWRKFLASQMTAAVDEAVGVTILAGEKYGFKANGRRNLFLGFLAVFQDFKKAEDKNESSEGAEKEEEETELPELREGEELTVNDLRGDQHFTKPPARFNDASLVKILEEEGIGRPSTYAPTIYTLLARGYVTRKGGALMPAELGETVADLLVQHFPKVLDVKFTAAMEEQLDRIEDGELDWAQVLRDFYKPFHEWVDAAQSEMKNMKREAVPTEHVCDVCGKHLVIRWGRFGKFLSCSAFPECKYTRSIPTGFRCPQPDCGGELIKRMSKRKTIFYGCSHYPKCNYIANKLPKEEESSTDSGSTSTTLPPPQASN